MKPLAETSQPASKDDPIAPRPETKKRAKKSAGMTRKAFGELIKRAFTQDVPKPR
jgi:hypothetical protein